MSILYNTDGARLILLQPGSDLYAAKDPSTVLQVEAFAQRHANDLGRPVDVYASDEVTWLYAVEPSST